MGQSPQYDMRVIACVLLAAVAIKADSEPYTIGQVAHGHGYGVVTGVDYGYGLVSGYGALGNRGYLGYGGLHHFGKREANAEAYTIGQVHHGLPIHNAYATGHPHNFGYTRYVSSPSVYSGVSHHGYTGHSVYPRVGHIGSYYV